MRKLWIAGVAAACLMSMTASGGARQPQQTGQTGQTGQGTAPHPHPTQNLPSINMGPDAAGDPVRERMQEQAKLARNNDRHKRMVDDTSKLLELSTELKSEVDKTTKDEMSIQVIQKAAEIERLAHDVKERMKG